MSLHEKLVRLAQQEPNTRKHLVPLLKEASGKSFVGEYNSLVKRYLREAMLLVMARLPDWDIQERHHGFSWTLQSPDKLELIWVETGKSSAFDRVRLSGSLKGELVLGFVAVMADEFLKKMRRAGLV